MSEPPPGTEPAPPPADPLQTWLADALGGVDALAVLAFAADRLRSEAAEGRRSSGDDVLALTDALETATAAHVLALGRFEANGTWRDGTVRSACTWIQRATDASRPQLARLLSAGRVTHDHEPFAEALATGRTSVAHVAAVGRVARKQRAALLARDAHVLARLAGDTPLEPYERAVAHWAGWADDQLADDDADRADASRSLTLGRTLGGWHLKGFLPTEDGELLRKLLDHIAGPPDPGSHPAPRTPAQRRADAFGTLLRRHARRRTTPLPEDDLDDTDAYDETEADGEGEGEGDGDGDDPTRPRDECWTSDSEGCEEPDDDNHPFHSQDDGGPGCCPGHGDRPPPTSGAPPGPPSDGPPNAASRRPSAPLVTVDVRIDLAHLLTVLDADRPPDQPIDERLLRAAAALPDLVPWSRGELERLLCDAWIGRILVDGPSLPLDLGRRTRTFTPAQRRAIAIAHPTCALCSTPVDDCDVHHMDEWDADHGPTNLANGIPLCPADHRLLHLARLRIRRSPDLSITVTDRAGRPVGVSEPVAA